MLENRIVPGYWPGKNNSVQRNCNHFSGFPSAWEIWEALWGHPEMCITWRNTFKIWMYDAKKRLTRLGDLLPFLLCSAVELPFPGFRPHGMAIQPLQQPRQNRSTWWVKPSLQRSLLTSPGISQSTEEWKFSSVKISLKSKSWPWWEGAHWPVWCELLQELRWPSWAAPGTERSQLCVLQWQCHLRWKIWKWTRTFKG